MNGIEKMESKNLCDGLERIMFYYDSKLNKNPLVIIAPIIRYSTVNKGWTLSFILCKYDIEHADVKAAPKGSKYSHNDLY